jgi:hypothetical protein
MIEHILIGNLKLTNGENDFIVQQLLPSIREHGILEPILIDKNNRVRDGNQRVRAAKILQLETVPFIRWKHEN